MMRDAYAGNTAGYMHLSLPGITTQPLLHEAMQQDMAVCPHEDNQTDCFTMQFMFHWCWIDAAPQTVAFTIYSNMAFTVYSNMEVKYKHADLQPILTAVPYMHRL